MITITTDCSGIGAPEMAFKELNIPHRVLFASEKDKFARKAYNILHSADRIYEDMTDRDNNNLPDHPDFYFAGIPCQPFSISGKRVGELDPRGTLFYNSWETIERSRPRFFVFENVKGLLSDNGGKTFQKWISLLAKSVNGLPLIFPDKDNLGYHVFYTVINTVHHGLPQQRDRVFIVGLRDDTDTFSWPLEQPLRLRLLDLLESNVPKKYFVSEKAIKFITRKDRIEKRHTQINGEIALTLTARGQGNWTGDFIAPDIIIKGKLWNSQSGKIYDPMGVYPTLMAGQNGYNMGYIEQQSYAIKEATQKGYSEAVVGDCINVAFPSSKTRRGRVGKGVSHTIDTQPQLKLLVVVPPKEKSKHFKPRIRKLTPKEVFRLQGFPDWSVDLLKKHKISDSQLYKMGGNTISIPVIKKIIINLLKNYKDGY